MRREASGNLRKMGQVRGRQCGPRTPRMGVSEKWRREREGKRKGEAEAEEAAAMLRTSRSERIEDIGTEVPYLVGWTRG